jgi:hypothetical protein
MRGVSFGSMTSVMAPVMGTAEQWRDVLLTELLRRQLNLRVHFAYYEGDHPLPRAPKAARDAYRRLLKQSRTNWVQLVIDSVAERLEVVGFRFGDQNGDDDAWAIWQANQMDADAELAQTDALTCGVNYVSVWPNDDSPVGVYIAPEHPTQTIVAFDPAMRRNRVAALKAWVEPNALHCWLTLPEFTYEWVAVGNMPFWSTTTATAPIIGAGWELVAEGVNPLGVVPIVELRPWPRTQPLRIGELPGRSEMDGVTDVQDRINTTIFNRMMATEYAAFRQKWATGMQLPTARDPVTGEPLTDPNTGDPMHVSPFEIAVDRLLVAEDADVHFGEFSESDLTGYIKAVEADVRHLAAVTKTPPHYLLGEIVNASGDALKAAETGLVSKVRRRASHFGEGWEEVMRCAFLALGDPRAQDFQAEVLWADFETRSEAQLVDALTKMATLGVPYEVLWQRWGASPQEIERWKQMAAEQAAITALATPVPASAPSGSSAPSAAPPVAPPGG